MKYKLERVPIVEMGGADMSRKQGPLTEFVRGCDRPRVALAAGIGKILEQGTGT